MTGSAVGNTVYFVATDATNGDEVRKADGMPAGTALVQDFGAGTGVPLPSPPTESTNNRATAPRRQTESQHSRRLRQAAQNPISGLNSLTLQLTFDGGVGSFHRAAATLQLQPLLALGLSRRLTLVPTFEIPYKGIPDLATRSGTEWGFGDVSSQFYLAINIGHLFIGPGITMTAPTATSGFTGAGKWQLGPALSLVWVEKTVVAGFLFSQAFSVGGDDSRHDVTKFSLQPLLFFNLPKGTFLLTSPLITRDWSQSGSWTVPVGAGVGTLMHLGRQAANINVQGYWNAVAPSIGPDWTVLFQAQLLFPENQAGAKKP
jgi:ELWxxDGT repeat protein